MHSSGNLYGNPQFISNFIIQNQERVNELNDRIASRNIASHDFTQPLDPRSQTTSNIIFPGLHLKAPSLDCAPPQSYFNTHQHFIPGDKQPFTGFASQVKAENELIFSRPHCDEVFVPSSSSDLFQTDSTLYTNPRIASHPLLNRQFVFQPRNMNPHNLGSQHILQAHTRQDVRNIDPIQ